MRLFISFIKACIPLFGAAYLYKMVQNKDPNYELFIDNYPVFLLIQWMIIGAIWMNL